MVNSNYKTACQKSLAEFAARRRQIIGIIFHRDMCVGKNTSQAASVEFCRSAAKLCAQQTASLLSENSEGIFDSLYKSATASHTSPMSPPPKIAAMAGDRRCRFGGGRPWVRV